MKINRIHPKNKHDVFTFEVSLTSEEIVEETEAKKLMFEKFYKEVMSDKFLFQSKFLIQKEENEMRYSIGFYSSLSCGQDVFYITSDGICEAKISYIEISKRFNDLNKDMKIRINIGLMDTASTLNHNSFICTTKEQLLTELQRHTGNVSLSQHNEDNLNVSR